jgi:glycerol-3-phosphate acyltransferase PlsX
VSEAPVVVAVDAGGADLGPAEVAAGAALAAEQGARVLLFGDAASIGPVPAGVEVVDAPLSIAKAAHATAAVRSNPNASIVQATRAVASGRAQALVTAGSTGSALAASLFVIKRGRGIYRPALALPLPIPDHPVTLLDVGANAEARREHLVQFAFMGAALSHAVLGIERPRVALLSNGEEEEKGREVVKEVHHELRTRTVDSLTFIGNVEGSDITAGLADVIVTDGFTGNVALKLMEGVSQALLGAIRSAAMSSPRGKVGGLLLRPALGDLRTQLDPEGQGGAYLLGLRQLGVVPHGRFTRHGFAQAILRAERGVREDVVGRTHRALELAGALKISPMSAAEAPASAPDASVRAS